MVSTGPGMTKTAGRRRADSPNPPEYDLPTREPRIESPRTARLLMFCVLVAWIVGTVAAGTSVVAVDPRTTSSDPAPGCC